MNSPKSAPSPSPRRRRAAIVDTVVEAGIGVLGRPGRTWLTVLGMTIGIAALVAIIGIAQSGGRQIVARLEALDRTLVQVSTDLGQDAEFGIPWNVESAVRRIDGVEATGALAHVAQGATVETLEGGGPVRQSVRLDVAAASHGLIGAVEAELAEGRFFDPLLDVAPYRAVVLGSGAARLLGVERITPGRDALFINGVPHSVIGILASSGDEPTLANTILISRGSLQQDNLSPDVLYVRTDRGAAGVVAGQLATVVNPNHPDRLTVSAPATAAQLQEAVESDVDALFVTIGIVAVIVAALGISNITLVAVVERRGEIGLRRALGATRPRIGAEFLTESTVLGLVGGILGSSVGVIVVSVAAARRGWLPVIDPAVVLLAPLLGAITGLLAGIYPALRAAALEPTQALRGG